MLVSLSDNNKRKKKVPTPANISCPRMMTTRSREAMAITKVAANKTMRRVRPLILTCLKPTSRTRINVRSVLLSEGVQEAARGTSASQSKQPESMFTMAAHYSDEKSPHGSSRSYKGEFKNNDHLFRPRNTKCLCKLR